MVDVANDTRCAEGAVSFRQFLFLYSFTPQLEKSEYIWASNFEEHGFVTGHVRSNTDVDKFNEAVVLPYSLTRTATLHRDSVRKLREHWIYIA